MLAPSASGRHNNKVENEGKATGEMSRHNGSERYRWHAVFCKPQQDERAEAHLLNQGFDIFRPKTRQRVIRNGRARVRIESMFPRYLFVRLNSTGQDWTPIRSTRGALGLVRSGQQAAEVPEQVIEALRQRCDDHDILQISGEINYQPDEAVEIIDGPCAGYRALFKARTGQERVQVLLTLLNHERCIEIPESAIRRA